MQQTVSYPASKAAFAFSRSLFVRFAVTRLFVLLATDFSLCFVMKNRTSTLSFFSRSIFEFRIDVALPFYGALQKIVDLHFIRIIKDSTDDLIIFYDSCQTQRPTSYDRLDGRPCYTCNIYMIYGWFLTNLWWPNLMAFILVDIQTIFLASFYLGFKQDGGR